MRKIGVALAAAVVAMTGVIVASPAEAATYAVSAKLSKSWMTLGTTVEISGKLTPATPNKTVTIQRFKNGSWVTSKSTKTNSDGKYKTALRPSSFGQASYRAVTAAKGSTKAGKSAIVDVDVFTWFDLAEVGWVTDDSRMYFDGGSEAEPAITIKGKSFGDDAWQSNEDGFGSTTWDLGHACMKIKGTAGLDQDQTDTGGQGRLKIFFDGAGDYSRLFDEGDSLVVIRTINFTGDLTISSTRTGDENAVVGYGQPRVFCKEELAGVS